MLHSHFVEFATLLVLRALFVEQGSKGKHNILRLVCITHMPIVLYADLCVLILWARRWADRTITQATRSERIIKNQLPPIQLAYFPLNCLPGIWWSDDEFANEIIIFHRLTKWRFTRILSKWISLCCNLQNYVLLFKLSLCLYVLVNKD